MKRASRDEEAKSKAKYQILLQDFLDLQKDFVTNKKKLQVTEQKRAVLLAEVRFLRERRDHLMKMQSEREELDKASALLQRSDAQSRVQLAGNYYRASEVTVKELTPTMTSTLIEVGGIKINGTNEDIVWEPMLGQKRKSSLITENQVGKKKISWQDQVALEV